MNVMLAVIVLSLLTSTLLCQYFSHLLPEIQTGSISLLSQNNFTDIQGNHIISSEVVSLYGNNNNSFQNPPNSIHYVICSLSTIRNI